jgi:hypothetical protein
MRCKRAAGGWPHSASAIADLSTGPVAVQVDGRLLGSALARVRWELDLLRGWQRNPCFYLEQSLVPLYDLLLVPPPFGGDRAEAIVRQLANVPAVLEQARANLGGDTAASFTRRAMLMLGQAQTALDAALEALVPELPAPPASALPAASRSAVTALAAFRGWLGERLGAMSDVTSVGAQPFGYFLHRVALLPHPARSLRAMARQEANRATAAEAILRRRVRGQPPVGLIADAAEQITRQRRGELDMRRFYAQRGILSQPEFLRHYRFAAMPAYLAPLTWLGVPGDLTSPARCDEDALRYVHEPGPGLPYFERAKALDPRTACPVPDKSARCQSIRPVRASSPVNPARGHNPDDGIGTLLPEQRPASGGLAAEARGLAREGWPRC